MTTRDVVAERAPLGQYDEGATDKLKGQPCFLIPSAERLVVEEDNFKYSGRIVIPKTAERRPTTGTVVSTPEDGLLKEWLGRRVLYAAFSGTLVTFKNRPAYRVLGIAEILAVITTTDDELDETGA